VVVQAGAVKRMAPLKPAAFPEVSPAGRLSPEGVTRDR
jgi:hypothetical protein